MRSTTMMLRRRTVMLCLRTTGCAGGLALATALVANAAVPAGNFNARLMEGQKLRAESRFAEARATYQALLQDVRKQPSSEWMEALIFDSLGIDEQDSGDYGAS